MKTMKSITEPVLVINAGSSSLKAKLLPKGHMMLIERIGSNESLVHTRSGRLIKEPVETYEQAFDWVMRDLLKRDPAPNIIGHRLVHGGTKYRKPVEVTPEVLAELEELNDLAPLHNPANIAALKAAMAALPDSRHVVAFDTAFHASLPPVAYRYAIPNEVYEKEGIRRYGFHGTSHDYVSRQAARVLDKPREEMRIVTLHLGNGASIAAIDGGRSVDTSMGYTPLEGLMMGTRSGDLDPGIILHLLRRGYTLEKLDKMLNRKSGLLGVSGISNDMRDVRNAAKEGHSGAQLAIDLFVYRVRKTIGAYAAVLGGLDAVVFTGGIGENDAQLRADIVKNFEYLGMELHSQANEHGATVISSSMSQVSVLVIQTNEELAIAKQAIRVVEKNS